MHDMGHKDVEKHRNEILKDLFAARWRSGEMTAEMSKEHSEEEEEKGKKSPDKKRK